MRCRLIVVKVGALSKGDLKKRLIHALILKTLVADLSTKFSPSTRSGCSLVAFVG